MNKKQLDEIAKYSRLFDSRIYTGIGASERFKGIISMVTTGYGRHYDLTDYGHSLGLFESSEEIGKGIVESGNLFMLMADCTFVEKANYSRDKFVRHQENIITYHSDPSVAAQTMLYFLNKHSTGKLLSEFKLESEKISSKPVLVIDMPTDVLKYI